MGLELTFIVVFFGLLEATHAMDLNFGQMPIEVFGLFAVTVVGLINAGWKLTSSSIDFGSEKQKL